MNSRERARIDRIKQIVGGLKALKEKGEEINLKLLICEVMGDFGVTSRVAREYIEVAYHMVEYGEK